MRIQCFAPVWISSTASERVVEPSTPSMRDRVRFTQVYTLLRVCDDSIIGWSEDGTQILIKEPDRFAAEVCPKFFRHRNFNSFTRLLNMYQFHKVPSVQRDSKDVCFEHPHFQRGRDDLLPLVQRKGAQTMRDELMAREMYARPPFPPGSGVEPVHAVGPGQGLITRGRPRPPSLFERFPVRRRCKMPVFGSQSCGEMLAFPLE